MKEENDDIGMNEVGFLIRDCSRLWQKIEKIHYKLCGPWKRRCVFSLDKFLMLTHDLDFLHHFRGFVVDFYVDSNGIAVVIDL